MADYIYLLESRLSKSQQNALNVMREIARQKGLTIFLVGGAVRDLTSGSPVRDLDVVVQGDALKLKKDIEKAGGMISGESPEMHALYVQFPRSVKLEVGTTLNVTYPKPGKPVTSPANILEDLRRRDFTANAMALSLNEGSYGLLMDPLNGVADIENRELRLVSNYGFIEDPIRMIRAARLMARLGWGMDEKTAARYETGKQEGYISAASKFQLGYETEEIAHEEDPLRVLKRLEAEGWMKVLSPSWNSAKVNVAELERLRESQTQLQLQGIHPNTAAANYPMLTAKLSSKESSDLKASFPRQGFVKEIEALDGEAKDLAAKLSAKTAALPSQAWKLLHSAKPEAVLMVAHSSKSSAIQAKFKSFYTEWPQARQKVPYALMQEMRIVPDLPGYEEFVDSLVFELMDGKLGTVEEMKAFLEPFSPPAPPPPVHLRRPRAAKKEAKAGKGRAKKGAAEASAEDAGIDLTADTNGEGDAQASVEAAPKPVKAPAKAAPVAKSNPGHAADHAAAPPVAAKNSPATGKKAAAPVKTAAKANGGAAAKKAVPAKKSAPASKAVTVKAAASKVPAKAPTKKTVAPKKTIAAKKPVANASAKKPLPKVVGKAVPVKKVVAKPVVKKAPAKVVAKPAAKKIPAKVAVKAVAKKAAVKVAAKAKGKVVAKKAASKGRR